MPVILIFGNSGAGKSTLARRLAREGGLAHLDLDTLAWEATTPPSRRALGASVAELERFFAEHPDCVVEGCYADLLAAGLPRCTTLLFLNPGVEACLSNARARPWEPHKYPSKAAQDANLEMLLGWIRDYETRADEFSLRGHRALFESFGGEKRELTDRARIAAFSSP
jgi:adenylate kinase family enzyme